MKQKIHQIALRIHPQSPSFNLISNRNISFPHSDFFFQTEPEILHSLSLDLPSMQKFDPSGQNPIKNSILAIQNLIPQRINQFERIPTFLPPPKVKKSSFPSLETVNIENQFKPFLANFTCPICRISYAPEVIAIELYKYRNLFDFKQLQESVQQLEKICQKAFLEHLSCEKLRLQFLCSKDEICEAKYRNAVNESIIRYYNDQMQ